MKRAAFRRARARARAREPIVTSRVAYFSGWSGSVELQDSEVACQSLATWGCLQPIGSKENNHRRLLVGEADEKMKDKVPLDQCETTLSKITTPSHGDLASKNVIN